MNRRDTIKALVIAPYITFPVNSVSPFQFNDVERLIIRALSPHMHLENYPRLHSISWKDNNIDYCFQKTGGYISIAMFDKVPDSLKITVRTNYIKSDSTCYMQLNAKKINSYLGKDVMLAEKW